MFYKILNFQSSPGFERKVSARRKEKNKFIDPAVCVREMMGPVVWKETFGSIPSVPIKGTTAGNNRDPQQREMTGDATV